MNGSGGAGGTPAGALGTGVVLAEVRRLLDAVDHPARAGIGHTERLALVTAGRHAARQLDALVTTLVAEADQANSAMAARGTPTTSWLTLDGATSPKEAAGLVFAGRDLTHRPAVQQAALAGHIAVAHARRVAQVWNVPGLVEGGAYFAGS